jgi:hypothetical protein
MSDQALGIAIASCLGLTSAVGIGMGGSTGGVKRVECVRFRVGGDGYESPVDDEDEEGDAVDARVKETFDVFFGVNFGGLSGEWVVKGLEIRADEGSEEAARRLEGEVDGERGEASQLTSPAAWKTKFLDAQRRLWEKEEEVKSLKDKILEAVL